MQKKSISLTLLGGVNDVGGNIILLEDLEYDVKIFLDFLEENIRSHIQVCLLHKEHPLIRNDLKYYYYNILKNRDLDVLYRENELKLLI